MESLNMTDTLALVFQGFAFVLVAGALAMIVHALARSQERWGFAPFRFVWVLLGVAYIVVMAAALIFKTDLAATSFGIGALVIYAVELTYLLRVVFGRRRPAPAAAIPPEPEPLEDADEVDLEFTREPRP
ncbi:MAG TPA: hypothetical protein VFE45_01535 [Coriobacteriia bacterium]|nr:hypothetical protein [Coriobacteriia bacterium]